MNAMMIKCVHNANIKVDSLSTNAKKFYKQGYLILKNFATVEEVKSLRRRSDELLKKFNPKTTSNSILRLPKSLSPDYASNLLLKNEESTKSEMSKQDLFLQSSSDVAFFLEENACDKEGNIKVSKELAVKKMGHAMHDVDPVFRKFSRSDKFKDLLKELGYEKPIPVQSLYIYKQPRHGSMSSQHQDSTYLYSEPDSCIGFWLALEDANIENGCLCIVPGSHLNDIKLRYKRVNGELKIIGEKLELPKDDFIAAEVKMGTLICLHGSVMHCSGENHSEKSRHAYIIHYVEGKDGYKWSEENWLQRPLNMPFEPLYIN